MPKSPDYVCRKRKQDVKQPVLEHRPVGALPAHPTGRDEDVRDPAETQYPRYCDNRDFVPWRANERRQQQHESE